MKILKVNQLTPEDFFRLQGSELFSEMIKRRYEIKADTDEEAIAVWELIMDHCEDIWFMESIEHSSTDYYVYFSNDQDEAIMMGMNEREFKI